MKRSSVKTIVLYYYGIPDMKKMLRQEKDELEERYDSMEGVKLDGMPRKKGISRKVEKIAVRLTDEKDVQKRIGEINEKLEVLNRDEASVRGCMDAVNGRYKMVLKMRYFCRYSWTKISMHMKAPDSTVRNWHDKALDRLGEELEALENIGKILLRSLQARN